MNNELNLGLDRTLVSEGAANFIKKYGNGITFVPPETMISPTARQTWIKWKDKLENEAKLNSEVQMEEAEKENILQDTVGAVAWHPRGGFAAGVSR
jgi:taspase (threonine aspartase 1)